MLNTVVVGIGNRYRRDDGVGLAVAVAVQARALRDVRVVTGVEDPTSLLDVWSGVGLAVLVDAALTSPLASAASGFQPGHIHQLTMAELTAVHGLSSHHLDIAEALALGQALDRVPDRLVVFTVEAADVGHGEGLTRPVAAAVPDVVAAVVAEIVGDETVGSGRQVDV